MQFEHATSGLILLLIVLILPVIISIRKAKAGANLWIRRIPGIDAIEESIGRSVEMGRPVSFTTGLTGLGPVVYACLGVLYHVAKRLGVYRSRLIVPQTQPEVLAISEDVLREARRAVGRDSSIDSRDIPYLSDAQFAFAAGYMGLVQRENVGTALLFGDFAAESLILAEAGQGVGAMQVAATTSPEQAAFFVCTCDYTLIGEELFAASAYLTREPVQLGSVYGQDRAKAIILLAIVLGVLMETLRVVAPQIALPSVVSLLQWSLW